MRNKRMLFGAAAGVMAIGLVALASLAASNPGPCEQITEACRAAGFAPGAARSGRGLKADCVNPIMQGGLQPRRAVQPLPPVSARLIKACKGLRPSFGQGKWSRFARSNRTHDVATPGFTQPAPASASPGTRPPAQRNLTVATQPDPKAGNPPPSADVTAPPPSSLLAGGAQNVPASPPANGSKRPNIVFILTDDLSTDLVQFMPHVLQMQKDGVTFRNYFVTDSLCCPSRASIFTGRYPHDTGIYRNWGADGGYETFHSRGLEQTTFATALSAAGYRTAMLGKYLNRYRPEKGSPVAPGWTMWAVAGNGYHEFNYTLSQDGKLVHYANNPTDYLTDVVSGLAIQFIKQSGHSPFMIEVATFAPHRPYTPAPRDANTFPGLRAPQTPAFGAAPDPNAVQWLKSIPMLSDNDVARIDREYRRRAQSVLAVDKMIGDLQAALIQTGEINNTIFVFSSDNGYHLGEHRLLPGKQTAYDTDIHVPLIVTGPGIRAGSTVDEIAQNIDLCPTFTELAGATVPPNVNGRSLVPLLYGQKVSDWRTVALVEHHGPMVRSASDPDAMDFDDEYFEGRFRARRQVPGRYGDGRRHGNPPSYEALRNARWVYVEYADGDKEYHDLATDPYELRNTFSTLSDGQKGSLHAMVSAIQNCHSADTCRAAERSAAAEPQAENIRN